MMPSFISLFTLMISVMVIGKVRSKANGMFPIVLIAALLQTAITLFDLYTMEVPTP